ncbi:hypothetical protein [Streptomyces sp. NPDC002516]
MALPTSLVPELAHHLAEHAEAGRTGLVFVGARGGVLRRNNFRRIWLQRMGHSSVRAALVYQHLVNGRDHEIADYVDGQIRKVKRPPRGPSGT